MPNQEELNSLLNQAAKRLGANPAQLKQSAQNGDLSKMLGKLSANDAKKLEQVLRDPEAANQILNTPQAQALMKRFL